MNDNIRKQLAMSAESVNSAVELLFENNSDEELSGLIEAQKYSMLSGGKRIRPILTLAFAKLFGGSEEAAMPYALAVEMIHTASLIHDDLPPIDNDDLRRSRPTNHKAFGEAVAILAADGLFMDAFGLVAKNEFVDERTAKYAIITLSDASGTRGLVGGEYIDVMGEGKSLPIAPLKKMHSMKTGALIRAAVELGALCAGVMPGTERMSDAVAYAENIGLAFQIVDDVLDATGTQDELGKPIGRDMEEKKSTFLSFYTPDEALRYAKELTMTAIEAISKYKGHEFLSELAMYLLKRRF